MRFEGSVFTTGSVTLDGSTFLRCKFENVELVYSGTAPVELQECSLTGVRWAFTGPALLTLRLLSSLYRSNDSGQSVAEDMIEQIKTGNFRNTPNDQPVSTASIAAG